MRLALGLGLCLVAGCTAAQVTQLTDAIKAGALPPSASAAPVPMLSLPPAPAPTPSASAMPSRHIPMTPPPPSPSPTLTPPIGPSATPGPSASAFVPNPFIGPLGPTPPPTPTASVSPGASPTPYQTPDPAITFKRTIVSPPYQGPVVITIDPGILGTASPAPFRIVGTDVGGTTTWQLFQPASGSDSVAFDPDDPAQLTARQIDPDLGDQTLGTAAVGGMRDDAHPTGRPFRFMRDHLIVYPKAASDLPTILSLVGGTQHGDNLYGSYLVGVTPAKADLSRLAANMRALSQYGPTPLSAVTFSSVATARLFALDLMLMMERTDLCWAAGLNGLAELD